LLYVVYILKIVMNQNNSLIVPITDFEWDFEKRFFDNFNFLKESTKSLLPPLVSAVIYLIVVFGGKAYMDRRPRFEVRNILFLWSFLLAIFSIVGTIRVLFVVYYIYKHHGLYNLVCSNSNYTAPIVRFWSIAFTLSKFAEFLDTVFIVIRKQKLIFLHWYHHITVMGYAWISYSGFYAGGLICMPMNFFVHALMYTYYAIRAYGIKVPQIINKCITALQIIQMIIGCIVMVAIFRWSNPLTCPSSQLHLVYGLIMYFSYLLLFANFFLQTYLKKQTTEKPNTQVKENLFESQKLNKLSVGDKRKNLRRRN